MGKGSSWIVKQGWQISGQTDRECSEAPPELPHIESGLLGLYMSALLSYQVVARENGVTSDGSLYLWQTLKEMTIDSCLLMELPTLG